MRTLEIHTSTRAATLEPQHLLLPETTIPSLFPDFPAHTCLLTRPLSPPWFVRIRRHLTEGNQIA